MGILNRRAGIGGDETKPGKRLLLSKTLWVNVIPMAAAGMAWLLANETVTTFLAANPIAALVAGVVMAGLNIAVRFITEEPVNGV